MSDNRWKKAHILATLPLPIVVGKTTMQKRPIDDGIDIFFKRRVIIHGKSFKFSREKTVEKS